jgi:hypothetical protein
LHDAEEAHAQISHRQVRQEEVRQVAHLSVSQDDA